MGRPLMTATNDSNPWWLVFKQAITSAGGKLSRPEILASTTDARYIRQKGIPVLGFSPMKNTPILLHDHNEVKHCFYFSLLFKCMFGYTVENHSEAQIKVSSRKSQRKLLLSTVIFASLCIQTYTNSHRIPHDVHQYMFFTHCDLHLQHLRDTVYLEGIQVYESLISALSSFTEVSQ